ncbi:helix-turn-helix domain-containing protein [Bacteroides timonensis]|uniref:helix-turn-helix domain-containing protein n=1 Tax=Bacteroides timonensis TaxID=1470345 RepID=UPI0004B204A0|nr:AraC family transcriptional regulator [Bacteroides timonensis]
MKRLFVPDDILSYYYSRQKDHVCLLQYTNVYGTENFDTFLTQHALVYILSGVKQINVSHSDFRINAGELFLIPKGEYVMSEYIAGEQGFRSMMLFFNQKVARYVVEQLNETIPDALAETKKKEAIKIIPNSPAIQSLFSSLVGYSEEHNPFLSEMVRLKFMELIYLLLDSPYRKIIISFLLDAARYENPSITSVLERYLYSAQTVEELAKIAGRSLSGFKREFTRLYGEAPMTWIRKKKLEHAAFLLEKSDKSIEDIADASGFISASHFARLFKAQYSVSPSAYRAKQTDI